MKDKISGGIDGMYADFINKLLPNIQEGLVITKDYFVDLFGRYIQYLIVTDIMAIVGFLVLISLLTWATIKSTAKFKDVQEVNSKLHWTKKNDDILIIYVAIISVSVVGIVFAVLGIYDKSIDLVKAVFVPEIRVYEEVVIYKNLNNIK